MREWSMAALVRASEEMREGFGLSTMESPDVVRAWFEDLFRRYDFTHQSMEYFRSLRLEAGDLSAEWGGGFWWGDRRLVQVRGCQDEAAIHELAHAFWHDAREVDTAARDLMAAVVALSQETDPRYARAQKLAYDYVNGIPTQPDENSPTGYWRGMLVEENDWEMFAGLASGVMGDVRLLPSYVRRFFAGLFVGASDDDVIEA
jgi:hypothetical protein